MMQNAMRNRRSEKRVVQIVLEATVRVNFKLIIQERGQQYENTGPIGRSLQHGSRATRSLQGRLGAQTKPVWVVTRNKKSTTIMFLHLDKTILGN